jgi:trigger factor
VSVKHAFPGLTLPSLPNTFADSPGSDAQVWRSGRAGIEQSFPIELSVNVTLEHLGPCKKLLRIEVDASRVKSAYQEVTTYFAKHASLPGFRPGKAPREMILKKFDADIQKEVRQKLYGDIFRDAVKQHELEVVANPDVEEIQFGIDQDAKVAFTVETAPKFEVPEYRGLAAKRGNTKVSDEDIDRALDALRERKSTFETVDRAAESGDFVVVNYQGSCEGQPITALAPTAKGLTEQKNFWMRLEKDYFIPGFTDQLVGAKAGDRRTVNVDFPADFVTPQLQNKKGAFEVEVVEVKNRILPALDDAFAQGWKAENLHQLREGVRSDLQNELNSKDHRNVRSQVVQSLMEKVQFDLPEVSVNQETRNVVYNIVAENQQRGVAKELIEQQKDQIYAAAAQTAKDRVKASFLFNKIAIKEGIKVSNDELNVRVVAMARHYQTTPEKLVKELEKRNGLQDIYNQMLHEKVVDFLQQHAKIEEASA